MIEVVTRNRLVPITSIELRKATKSDRHLPGGEGLPKRLPVGEGLYERLPGGEGLHERLPGGEGLHEEQMEDHTVLLVVGLK